MSNNLDQSLASQLHIPVLKKTVLDYLAPKEGALYLDGTLGLGGHAEALLKMTTTTKLVGLDRDLKAIGLAKARLSPYSNRVQIFQSNYADFALKLKDLGIREIEGALLDLGVSSLQLDDSERGFSFNHDAKLDMRMDQTNGNLSAYDLVNSASIEKLREIIASLGEEPLALNISKAIVSARQNHKIETTLELANIVAHIYSKHWHKKSRNHPATRTFQALRLYINDELGQLQHFLNAILPWLKIGGRLVIITFHSLEDRLVKQFMQQKAKGCICPTYLPRCQCEHKPEVKILTKKPLVADETELRFNPRSSSAKLRACEKIA